LQTDQLLDHIIEQATEFKALNPRVLKVTEHCGFADYFVFLTGTSSVHIQSIAEAILLDIKRRGLLPIGVEGVDRGEWCLLDFGDVVVHVFNRQTREYYDLESFWKAAPCVYPVAE